VSFPICLQDSNTGADKVIVSNVHETIRDVFGTNSPEFREHGHLRLWVGGLFMGMEDHQIIETTERGRKQAIIILKGLIQRLTEKKEVFADRGTAVAPSSYFRRLNLHPRILEVS
jgi:hypothetical protein